jgi:hypothetical protein
MDGGGSEYALVFLSSFSFLFLFFFFSLVTLLLA